MNKNKLKIAKTLLSKNDKFTFRWLKEKMKLEGERVMLVDLMESKCFKKSGYMWRFTG